MLHNTGPFGPNETPINVSGQASMSDIGGQMNIGNSINNLPKIGSQSSQPANTHFNLPDYANYGLNMNAAMNNFHNFHQAGYQQTLIQQSASNSWQNSVLPMNLNTQSDPHSMLGYYDKKFESQTELSEQNFNKSMLNIPQVYTKALHKHLGMDAHPDYFNNFNNYLGNNLDLCVRSQKDSQSTLDSRLNLQQKSRSQFAEQIDLSRNKNIENQNISTRSAFYQKSDKLEYLEQVLNSRSKDGYVDIDARLSSHQKSPQIYSQLIGLNPKDMESLRNQQHESMSTFPEQVDLSSRKPIDSNISKSSFGFNPKNIESANLISRSLEQQRNLSHYPERDLSNQIRTSSPNIPTSQLHKLDRFPSYHDQVDLSGRSKDERPQLSKAEKLPSYYDQVDLRSRSKDEISQLSKPDRLPSYHEQVDLSSHSKDATFHLSKPDRLPSYYDQIDLRSRSKDEICQLSKPDRLPSYHDQVDLSGNSKDATSQLPKPDRLPFYYDQVNLRGRSKDEISQLSKLDRIPSYHDQVDLSSNSKDATSQLPKPDRLPSYYDQVDLSSRSKDTISQLPKSDRLPSYHDQVDIIGHSKNVTSQLHKPLLPYQEQVDLSIRSKDESLEITKQDRTLSYHEQVDLSNRSKDESPQLTKQDRLPSYYDQVDLSSRSKDVSSQLPKQDRLLSYHDQVDLSRHTKDTTTQPPKLDRLPPDYDQVDLSCHSKDATVQLPKPDNLQSYHDQIDLSSRSKDISFQAQESEKLPSYYDQVDLSTRSKDTISSQPHKPDTLTSYKQADLSSQVKNVSSELQEPDALHHYDQIDLSSTKNENKDCFSLELPSDTKQVNLDRSSLQTDNAEQIDLSHTKESIENSQLIHSPIKNDVEKSSINSQQEIPEEESPQIITEAKSNENLDLSLKSQEPLKDSLKNRPKHNYSNDPEQRRRNLANTVRMIENILIQTTKKKTEEDANKNEEKAEDDQFKDDDVSQSPQSVDNLSDDQSISSTDDINDEEMATENENKAHEVFITEIKQECPSESEMEVIDVKKEKIDDITIKVEIAPDLMYIESLNPFQRDYFGVQSEEVGDANVHDSENSVAVALDAIKNGTEHNNSFYECPHCCLFFAHPKRFLIHTKWHSFGLTNEKRMELQREKEMRKTMRREAKVLERMHQNEVTEVENVAGKTYNCNDCGKVFLKKASLQNHRQRYHPTRPRECKICGKLLVGWLALRDHHLTHFSAAGYYQCDDCPKKFKYSHSLAKHRDTHLEKTHGCQQCSKMFGSAALLNVHMKTHERVLRGATFRCTYCGKGFFESYHLQAHERTHRNERPFGCEICKTAFGTKSGLARHLKVSHSSSKPWECSTCHRSFVSEAIRDRHEQRNHGNPEDFKFVCKQCPCRYMKLKDLRKHVYKVHPKGRRKKKSESDSE